MIPQISEINFPDYATLSQATISLNDMGDKTISAQIKIEGNITPDFSYDWEVEFKGERYIQPLRQPQASKGNESICSVIDLVFQHKTIYDLKRYYFAKMAEVQSGTVSVDKYIADLNVNIEQFKVALQNVLDFYFKEENRIIVSLYGEDTGIYAQEPQNVQIQYSHIWDVVQKIYDLFGVRWSIEGREIKIGYPTEEVAHTFEYGFEGGLLKVERQVQSADIRNSLLGRGGSKNLPYRYFKDTDPQNPSFQADPDWIPELANIYFTELRGKTFRDYVKGWKAKHYGGEPMQEPTEAYTKGYTDAKFNPVEYVEDKESIAKYGLLQGGLENQEDIYPTIQGVEVDGLGRVDEIVGAEQVIIDEATSDYTPKSVTMSIDDTFTGNQIEATNVENEYILRSDTIHQFNEGSVGYIMSNPSFKTTFSISYFDLQTLNFKTESGELDTELLSYKVFDVDNNSYLNDIVSIPSGIRFKVEYKVRIKPHSLGSASVTSSYIFINSNWSMSSRPFAGEILENLNTDGTRKSVTIAVPSKETTSVTIQSDTFTIPEDGATNIDVPVSINTDLEGEGLYEWKRDIEVVNTETNEVVTSINIPQGTYYLRVKVEITNNSDSAYDYKVELLPSYILYPTDSEEFKPTFDIWVKNIWNTTRNAGESNEAYTNRVWTPILGDREGNEAKVVFTTGWLSGHSDYEFVIRSVEYAGDSGVELDGVPAEWKIELIKSEAEIEATGKWIPSTTQQAIKGDKFFFIGIDMPHEYTLWAEQTLDNYKSDQLLETAHIKPTWVVQTDKVRLNQLQPNETEPLLNALKIGNSLRLADTRFTNGVAQTLYLQSVTYTWQEGTNIVPDVEVVLSDKVTTSTNPVAKLQGEVNALTKQVGSISNIQQVVRAIGDKLYLRKDGFDEVSNSATEFNKLVSSRGYRQGAFGGRGWGLRNDGEKGVLEVDKLVVRNELQVNTIVSNQIEAIGGKQIESAARITCTKVEDIDGGYKCYFDQKQGSVVNLFKVNDIALSQVFSPDNSEVKHYKRVVEAVDNNSITLSKTRFDGDGMPQEGDVIVHFGNTTDPNRQYVIIRDVIGGGYERMLSNLNSVSALGEEYYFAGRMEGDTPRWFVGNNEQYIEYKDGEMNIKANVTIGEDSPYGDSTLGEAFASASGNKVFYFETQYEVPTNYKVGDLWIINTENYGDYHHPAGAKNGEIWVATTSSDDFDKAHWEDRISYNTAIEDVKAVLEGIQTQVDGVVISYFYEYDASIKDYPASEWTTEALKESHIDDTFTNITTGSSWRWKKEGNTYLWEEIKDTATQKSLILASRAQETADNKRRVFVDTPTPPYDKGDLWTDGIDLYRCKTAKADGESFSKDDWEFATAYTDDAAANAAKKVADDAKSRLESWVEDGKISRLELEGIKAEFRFVVSDVEDITKSATNYVISQDVREEFSIMSTSYKTTLEKIIKDFAPEGTATPDVVDVPISFAADQRNYYDARSSILEAIAAASKAKLDELDGAVEDAKNAAAEALAISNTINDDEYLTPAEKRTLRQMMAELSDSNGVATPYWVEVTHITAIPTTGAPWYRVQNGTKSNGNLQDAWVGWWSSNVAGQSNGYTAQGVSVEMNNTTAKTFKIYWASDAEIGKDYLTIRDFGGTKIGDTASDQSIKNKSYSIKSGDSDYEGKNILLTYQKDQDNSLNTDAGYYKVEGTDSEYWADGYQYLCYRGSYPTLYAALYNAGKVNEANELKTRFAAIIDCLQFAEVYGDENSQKTTYLEEVYADFRTDLQKALNEYHDYVEICNLNDVDYLKKVFPNAVVNVNGAVLSSLLAVKDATNENIVAGLYGGGDYDLNKTGLYDNDIYEDEETGQLAHEGHGALMIFAGAESLGNVSEANARIYEDGHAVFNDVETTGGFKSSAGGKRIEVHSTKDGKDAGMYIYADNEVATLSENDSSAVLVTSFTSDRRDISSLFPNESQTIALRDLSRTETQSTPAYSFSVEESLVSNSVAIDKAGGILKTPAITGTMSIACDLGMDSSAWCKLSIFVNGQNIHNQYLYAKDGYTNVSVGINCPAWQMLQPTGDVIITAKLEGSVSEATNSDHAFGFNITSNSINAIVDYRQYLASYFANGLALGSSTSNLFTVINNGGSMIMRAISTGYGINITHNGMQLRIGGTWYTVGKSGNYLTLTSSSLQNE